MKILWIDTETTGFSPAQNALIEIALMLEVDGVITHRYYSQIKPLEKDEIEQSALDVNKIDIEKIKKEPHIAIQEIEWFLKSCMVDGKKLIMGGQNTPFDKKFLLHFFLKNGFLESDFNKIFSDEIIDTRRKAETYFHGRDDKPMNMKLETLTEHFGIPLVKAHNAENDCMSTIELNRAITKAHLE